MICRICGTVYPDNEIEQYKDLMYCKECCVFQKINPPSKEDVLRSQSGMLISACNNRTVYIRRMENANKTIDLIETFIRKNGYKRLFDVGANAGFIMEVAAKRGWTVDGNEVSKAAIEYARKEFILHIEYAFLEDIKFVDTYDCFVLWNVLEHLLNPVEVLNIIYERLNDNGVIAMQLPLKYSENIITCYEKEHIFEYTWCGLTNLLAKKFEILYYNKFVCGCECVDIIGRKRRCKF